MQEKKEKGRPPKYRSGFDSLEADRIYTAAEAARAIAASRADWRSERVMSAIGSALLWRRKQGHILPQGKRVMGPRGMTDAWTGAQWRAMMGRDRSRVSTI